MKRSMFALTAALALMGTACSDPLAAPLPNNAALAAHDGGGGAAEESGDFAPYGVGAAYDRHACRSGPHRDFDFWVGRFDVTDATGASAGTNRIRRRLDGCLVTEHYVGPRRNSRAQPQRVRPTHGVVASELCRRSRRGELQAHGRLGRRPDDHDRAAAIPTRGRKPLSRRGPGDLESAGGPECQPTHRALNRRWWHLSVHVG